MSRIGKRQRTILDELQKPGRELWNDAGMWSIGFEEDGRQYTRTALANPSFRLFQQGYIYCVRIEAKRGQFGADRAVYQLTEKGKRE